MDSSDIRAPAEHGDAAREALLWYTGGEFNSERRLQAVGEKITDQQ